MPLNIAKIPAAVPGGIYYLAVEAIDPQGDVNFANNIRGSERGRSVCFPLAEHRLGQAAAAQAETSGHARDCADQ